ncbi:uncharacterized protein [Anolis sagrei]|uniref:uncharacterized protein n=1 Tax=Anolis sagrei TaxID=38937 RepID=UPI00295A68AE|nr:uncharacterized LOC128125816 homolog [Anolis sagrei ordinatus]
MPRHSAFSRFRARYMGESFTLRYLKVLRELLAFIVFSYTVLLGALVLAAWTTYFLVAK